MAMDKFQVQTPKGRCEKLQSGDPARRGRSNVSLIYLLQRPRVSPNYVRGALVKLSTKKNRFPHTFSKAPCSGMQLFRTSRGRVQPRRLDACAFITLGAHARGLLCVSVYPSVPALAASASVETSKQWYSQVSIRLFFDFDKWIFEKTFRSKVMA